MDAFEFFLGDSPFFTDTSTALGFEGVDSLESAPFSDGVGFLAENLGDFSCGRLIQSKTGSRIIGEAMGTSFDSPAMERFFTAGLLSLNSYMSDRIEQSSR